MPKHSDGLGAEYVLVRWQYLFLVQIDSGVNNQEKGVCAGLACLGWHRAEGLGQQLLHTGIRTTSGKLSSDMENVFQDFIKQEL